MATAPSTKNTAASALPAAGGTSESTISSWAGPLVTNMLGQAQAISNTPYQVYQGPQTAGESGLQSKVFQGLGNLSFPGNLGQSFSSTGAYQPPQMNMDAYKTQPIGTGTPRPTYDQYMAGRLPEQQDIPVSREVYDAGLAGSSVYGQPNAQQPTAPASGIAGLPQTQQPSAGPTGIAAQYMNPYLQSVLDPQMAELRRQNEITNMQANAKATGMGAFGGGRQAIMNAENNRNLMQEMNKTVGQGYASAYDKGIGQFNIEQGQSKDLVNMLANAGQQQRGIEQEGITSDYNEFLAQRDYPMKQVQFLQSMLQGMPYQTITNSPLPKSGMGQLTEIVGSLPGLEENLKNLGIIPK
jgi:hypothetical protein